GWPGTTAWGRAAATTASSRRGAGAADRTNHRSAPRLGLGQDPLRLGGAGAASELERALGVAARRARVALRQRGAAGGEPAIGAAGAGGDGPFGGGPGRRRIPVGER